MFGSLIFVFIFSSLSFATIVSENIANTQRDQEANYCLLPPYPEHGRYTVSNYPSATPGERYANVKLDVSCDIGYKNKNTNNSIFCLNGNWSANMSTCVRDTLACGIISQHRQLESTSSKHVTLPWHTVIYEKWSSSYAQRCSGSLISETKIISDSDVSIISQFKNTTKLKYLTIASLISLAAHCFYVFTEELQPASNYVVAVNKQFRPYNDSRDQNSQQSHVADIKIPSSYRGRAANFEDDIAILYVETPFIFQFSVRPVCLDFDNNLDRTQLTEGNLGKSARWSIADNSDQLSEVLKVVDLTYIKFKHCYDNTPTYFQQYLTTDKFCAGRSNDTWLGIRDAGGGLAFLESISQRHYIRGVLTLGRIFGNDNTIFNTYTSVVKHEHFIKQHL